MPNSKPPLVMTPILMSRENPTGWKLEDLLEQLATEVTAKDERIKEDQQPVSQFVHSNNQMILKYLARAKRCQDDSYKALKESKGRDKGPKAEPRIG